MDFNGEHLSQQLQYQEDFEMMVVDRCFINYEIKIYHLYISKNYNSFYFQSVIHIDFKKIGCASKIWLSSYQEYGKISICFSNNNMKISRFIIIVVINNNDNYNK